MPRYHIHDAWQPCTDPALCEAFSADDDANGMTLPGCPEHGQHRLIVVRGRDAAHAYLGNVAAKDQYYARLRDQRLRRSDERLGYGLYGVLHGGN